jgi:hypothetical protein
LKEKIYPGPQAWNGSLELPKQRENGHRLELGMLGVSIQNVNKVRRLREMNYVVIQYVVPLPKNIYQCSV